ncbi:MAG: Uma2 family endonuclease, partial [Verrucomicrobia bacterium]|nr:Uma2 family endonuclease [Verrucomicrobiota bacterium]
ELLTGEETLRALASLLRPEPTDDGFEPEERLVICGVSWERYLALDQALGDNRSGPRFACLDGDLEIVTTSQEHERIKKWIGDLLAVYFEEAAIEIVPRGQATIRSALKRAGAEPDESWCIHGEKEFPDLVLEIVLTTGGVSKLEIYRQFNVPEVWFWQRQTLEIFALRDDGSAYEPVAQSRLLPELDVALLERCVPIRSWQQARRAFRAGLRTGK